MFSEQQERNIAYLSRIGMMGVDIAGQMDVSAEEVARYLERKRARQPAQEENLPSGRYSKADRDYMHEMAKSGASVTEVAEHPGRSVGGTKQALEKMGITISSRGKLHSHSEGRGGGSMLGEGYQRALAVWGRRLAVRQGGYSLDGRPINMPELARRTNDELVRFNQPPYDKWPPGWVMQ